jgi:secreted PhoX family phosphatase
MEDLTRRSLLKTSVAAAVGATVTGTATATGNDGPAVAGELKRFATTAFGAEVTGPATLPDGTLVFSLQHPADNGRNQPAFRDGAIGYVEGFQFGADEEFEELSIPTTAAEQGQVRTAAGEYTILARERESIDGGTERLGVPTTPDGDPLDEFAGSRYSAFGNDPDMNQFVAAPASEYDGYLFTNFEQSPGTLTRMPVTVDDGTIDPDLSNTVNLANRERLRSLGGTRINCYGDLSPWGTPLSAEEEYSHPRLAPSATVGDILEDSGIGRRGAAQFYNRPNPTEIQSLVGEYYDDDWYVQGYFALAGVELQAYYLGAEPRDQGRVAETNIDTKTPIADPYPNPYRYGYVVDFRNATAGDPDWVDPVKYYVMGRAAWEAPDVQSDHRTVYLTSDGTNKGIYKFVADRPISSYHDPMEVAGTLHAPKVTNAAAAGGSAPGEVPLSIDWIELGHATNAEVESWIADYDGVDQIDYLQHHTDDWSEGDPVTEAVLEAADREVIENGNRDYIADETIARWARQFAQRGPDGVDDELRRVPFLETRAAAKEVGATIEFRKAEGIDSLPDAGPGDHVYVGLSEFNSGLSDDAGDVRLSRVDGGVVYRGELSPDYDLTTLEPVIVGAGADDPANVADDALLNVDNVYVLEDGRVLCCEDADQLGRSYPNDGMYVFTPEELLDDAEPPAQPPGESPPEGPPFTVPDAGPVPRDPSE